MIGKKLAWLRGIQDRGDESGQSLVLIALLFAILLLFVGLAVDVGFGFARSSQFSRAVDSAALAGVVDLVPSSTTTTEADIRAAQFLSANGWPTPTLTTFDSDRSLTVDGIPQYTITATWPVETYFLRLAGIDGFPITHGATAAYFTNSELLAPTAFDAGRMRQASLFISGKEGCAKEGDPVITLNSTPSAPNEDYPAFDGRYRYRISIPSRYPIVVGESIIRVELFDPDSYNVNPGQQAEITHSDAVGGHKETKACISAGLGDQCIIETGESLDAAFQNPFWFWRVDENWDANCDMDPASPLGVAVTTYHLYYIEADGSHHTIGKYTVDNDADYLDTDLKWVSPSAPGSTVDADEGSFQFNFAGVPPNPDGSYSLFLDVTSEGGTAINVFDVWAGPRPEFYTGEGFAAPQSDVNLRNLQLAKNQVAYSSLGVRVYSLGRMPLSQYIDNSSTTFSMVPINIDLAEQTIYATVFDYDPVNNISGAQYIPPPTLNLTIDNIPPSVNDTYIDVKNIGAVDNACNPDETLHMLSTSCNSGQNCDNTWFSPQVQLCIPSTDYFGGGIVEVGLTPHRDMAVWQFAISAGDPFLTQ